MHSGRWQAGLGNGTAHAATSHVKCSCAGVPAPRPQMMRMRLLQASTPHPLIGAHVGTQPRRGQWQQQRQRQHTVCMAEPRRVARVSKQLEREIGNLFLYDKVLQKAICPERRKGLDSAASAIASVTEVRISNDLQVAKVYVSIFSDPQGKAAAIDQLAKLQGYVRKRIGQTMSLRLTPEIRFIYDEAHDRGERVLKLLKQIQLEERGEVEPPPIALPTAEDFDEDFDEDEDEEDEDDDDEEEGDSDDDDEVEGFFDDDDDDADMPPASRRKSGLSMAAIEQRDSSFFGFEDPGNAFVDDDDVAWQDEGELQSGTSTAAADADDLPGDDSSDAMGSQGRAGSVSASRRQ